MPNGPVHARITMVVAVVVIPSVSITSHMQPVDILLLVSGALLGLAINPDLDLSENRFNNDLQHISKNFLKFAWDGYWYMYGRLIHHRSPISHSPILGTLIRMIYMIPVLTLIVVPLSYILSDHSIFIVFVILFTGLCVSDLFHIIADILVSEIKRLI